MKSSARVVLLVATGLACVAVFPSAAGAAETFYARGGGGNTGASCAFGDECNLAKAVKKAEEVGAGSAVVLMPGPSFTPGNTLEVEGDIGVGGEEGQPRPTILGPEGKTAVKLNGSTLHDVNVIAGSGGDAVRVSNGKVLRVFARAPGAGQIACAEILSAEIDDSVCWAERGVGLEADVFGGYVFSDDAIGGEVGIAIRGAEAGGDEVHIVDTIASGGPGFADIAVTGKGTAAVSIEGSDYDSAGPGIPPPGTNGNLVAPPQFVEAASGDFHQLAGSPTIDAGVANPNPVPTGLDPFDLDHGPRALNGHLACGGPIPGPIDIGAFEYAPPPPVCPSKATSQAPPPPPPPPGVPGTSLGKAKIDSGQGTATFAFSGSGAVTGYVCELVRLAAGRGGRKGAKAAATHKAAKPRFVPCGSPKSYRHLRPGHYTFKVEATGPGGTDPTAAVRKFRIAP